MTHWEDLALETAERFGGTLPHPDTAAQIAAVYERAPHAVEKAIDRVALEYEQGGIRSPWGILRSRVKQITTSEATATRANERDKTIARAEQWMRNAGMHYDSEQELLDELYGERGRLRDHPDTRQRMLALWTELRPIGEQLDQDAIDRGTRYQEQRERLRGIQPPETPDQRLARQRELAAKKAEAA
jgi:hypothetical protein